MIRTLIIEDEPKVRDTLVIMIQRYCPELEICAVAATFEDGLAEAIRHQPQLVISDINLNSEEGNGIDLASLAPFRGSLFVFITGWQEYAVEAFRVNAVDYLMKPLNIQQLLDAVERVRRLLNRPAERMEQESMLRIPTTHGFVVLRVQDIVRCEADGAYTHILLNDARKRILCSINLGQLEKKLPARYFFRTHKSHLINKLQVREYLRGEGGSVVLQDLSEVPVSRQAKESFLNWLAE